MKFYSSPTSPFARKVLILLHEAKLISQVEVIDTKVSPLAAEAPALAALNPLGKVPTLELSSGPALYDSRVITRYLDELAGTGFYPSNPRSWPVLTLEATADGISDAAVAMAYEVNLRPKEYSQPEWVEGQWAKVDRALTVLEQRWLANLAGPLDIGQIALAAALGYIDLRHSARNWRNGRPGLAAWFAKMSERPSMLSTAPKA